ncbi:MAG: hypothetical protein IJ689_05390 [Alphaproteobacteria bacterium]|nr:hypothetical protein [Alphaproteobacteria bacterium]
MKKYAYYLRQIAPLLQNSWLAAAILLSGIGFFMFCSPFEEHTQNILHIGFFMLNLLSIGILAQYNRNRPLFFVIVIMLAYMLINYFKFAHGVIYYLTPEYINLVFLTAAGMLFFFFLPNRPFFSFDTANFLIVVFAAVFLGEILSSLQIKLDFNAESEYGHGLQIFGLSFLWLVVSIMLFCASIKDDIVDCAIVYAAISTMIGFYFSADSSALVLFFFVAALIVLGCVVRSVIFYVRKDPATGLDNGNTFLKKAAKLPHKYGLGIVCVGDYKHLLQAFRKHEIGDIMKMVGKKILELEPDVKLYRCTPDEFVLIFPNAEKGTSAEKVEKIRSQIGASEFILNRVKRPIKITVTCSVVDKKRSDANVSDVFIRAHRILQRGYKFTQNITLTE